MKTAETAAIERDYPEWTVWMSRQGRCWAATRRTPAEHCDPTVIADSAQELRTALAEQRRLTGGL